MKKFLEQIRIKEASLKSESVIDYEDIKNKESTKYEKLGCQIVLYIEKKDELGKLKTKNLDINKQRDKPTQLQ
ncbi:22880_t:CDS:2 [Cetraspora pellucida]|uniref:22880_t:CDS:1 n=1 Tax=Cetraspora pellucida TaxID=1433469 RepID=A0A9N8ZSL1_9GLOM|nr:22880_t:CDS:2 [Cetraspora pellucida]